MHSIACLGVQLKKFRRMRQNISHKAFEQEVTVSYIPFTLYYYNFPKNYHPTWYIHAHFVWSSLSVYKVTYRMDFYVLNSILKIIRYQTSYQTIIDVLFFALWDTNIRTTRLRIKLRFTVTNSFFLKRTVEILILWTLSGVSSADRFKGRRKTVFII